MADACTLEQPAAKMAGEHLVLPDDLYIPPQALRVFLEAFEGPLDLLLYLIRKQKIDILNIPMTNITKQYIEYVDLMQDMKIDLAAEYLLMAAMLAEIKSRILLPQMQLEEDEEEGDPRAELVRRLQEYARYQQAAYDLDALPLSGRDFWAGQAALPEMQMPTVFPRVAVSDLPLTMQKIVYRERNRVGHLIEREPLSVRERMLTVLDLINPQAYTRFEELYAADEGASGVVVSLLAILELGRQRVLQVVQAQPYSAIYLKSIAAATADAADNAAVDGST